MMDWQAYELHEGSSPLVISMPHSGTQLTDQVAQGLTDKAKRLPDTDWYIPKLYEGATALGATVLSANYSRYVIDLNRPVDDAPLYSSKTTGLFPHILFADEPVFVAGMQPDEMHQQACKDHIWQPYHRAIADQLARVKQQYGFALLLDAHSIASYVPMLFEGQLPDFNWGTNSGHSCAQELTQIAESVVNGKAYSQVTNGRFKGGYITRHFGQPQHGVHALQLELSQATYLQVECGGEYWLDDARLPAIQAILAQLVTQLMQFKPGS